MTVFTDIDCTYVAGCIEMAELNRLGIRVRYLMFCAAGRTVSLAPCRRSGSTDRRDADARQARRDDQGRSLQTPVAELRTRPAAGIRGTPGIISDSGEYIGGYLPPAQLAQLLSGTAASAAGD